MSGLDIRFRVCAGLLVLVVGSVSRPSVAQQTESDATAPSDNRVTVETAPPQIRYLLEKIDVRGNRATSTAAIVNFVTIEPGDLLDVAEPSVEAIRWRLMGSGWFSSVRLSLERGTKRGWVVLVIEVKERNTLIVTGIVAGLAKAVRSKENEKAALRPYGGMGIAETNLFGLGIGVSAAAVYSKLQQGVDLRYTDPMFLKSDFNLNARFFLNNARDFFGNKPNVENICPPPDPIDPEPCDSDIVAKTAVVIYKRFGVSLGTGHDVTNSLRYALDWQGELVDVNFMPDTASTKRGDENVPIDFSIDDRWSTVSTVHFGLAYDRRNDPSLPSKGQLITFDSRLGAGILGSGYDFVRLESAFRHWWRLPWGHVLSPGLFAGMVFGYAPFFYHFYASDLSDLVPSRVLELNLDHRGPHNLLHTSIEGVRIGDLAAKVDLEYGLPMYRGSGGVQQVQAYARVGVYALSDLRDVQVAIQGYEGAELIPVDLTFDLGIRANTSVGVFQLGFSTLMGFLPNL
jgi:outer membrane protein insertion porin family